VVGIDKYRDGGSFEKVVPVAQSTHDGQELPVIDGIVLLGPAEFLGMESHRVSCARFFCSIWLGRGGPLLVKYCSCRDLRHVNLQLELLARVWSDEYWG